MHLIHDTYHIMFLLLLELAALLPKITPLSLIDYRMNRDLSLLLSLCREERSLIEDEISYGYAVLVCPFLDTDKAKHDL